MRWKVLPPNSPNRLNFETGTRIQKQTAALAKAALPET